MSGWKDVEVEGSSDYLKLASGTTVTFHILSPKPTKNVVHWVNKKKENCLGKVCDFCAEGNKPKQRWMAIVWDRKDQKEKKFEFGAAIASQIKAIAEMLAESQQTIDDIDIRIKTTGSSMETEYTVMNSPVSGLIPAEVKAKYSEEVPF